MTIELLKLNLQHFSEDDTGNEPELNGDSELAAAIRGLLESEENSDENLDDIDLETNDEDDIEDEIEDDENLDDESLDDEDVDDDQYEEPVKNVQSKEDNAKFAQQRREREAQERAAQELERLKQESPEFQLAKMLSEQSGQPVEVIMEQVREAQLQKEAKEQQVPVDVLRRQREQEQETSSLRDEIAMLKFQNWQTTIQSDGARLMNEYSVLTQEDINEARDYILHKAKNVELPLEDAVFAVHGKKIVEAMAKNKVQDELANQSGRKKKTPLAPNNGKPPKVVSLTAEEKLAARAFGMTDEEYIKYK